MFRCSCAQTDGQLSLRYVLHNQRDAVVAAFNRIRAPTIDGHADLSPQHVFVHLESRTLHIAKLALNALHPVVPLATRILPGAAFEETLALPVPIRVCHPLERRALAGQVVPRKLTEATRLMVSIGVVELRRSEQLVASEPAYPDALSVLPDEYWAVENQEILSEELVLQHRVAVLDYEAYPYP